MNDMFLSYIFLVYYFYMSQIADIEKHFKDTIIVLRNLNIQPIQHTQADNIASPTLKGLAQINSRGEKKRNNIRELVDELERIQQKLISEYILLGKLLHL